MAGQTELLQIFSRHLREILEEEMTDWESVQEIRIRSGKPLIITLGNREYIAGEGGRLVPGESFSREQRGFVVSQKELEETMECAVRYSLYAFEDEIRQGFLTVAGGHRIGVAGRVVAEQGRVRTIKPITCLNIRVAHEVKGCGKSALPFLIDRDRGELYPTLLISPPCCGKTTLLRDIVRSISDGCGYMPGKTVGIVDERSEIAASFQGIAQNDIGMRSDVLDNCPKAEGMMMLIRSMAPQVVAVDEIGGREDLEALHYAVSCGCSLIATVHGTSFEDVSGKPVLGRMLKEGMFQRIVILSNRKGPGTIERILDGEGNHVGTC